MVGVVVGFTVNVMVGVMEGSSVRLGVGVKEGVKVLVGILVKVGVKVGIEVGGFPCTRNRPLPTNTSPTKICTS